MSVYKRLTQADFINSLTYAEPQFHFVSGTSGWRGNVGLSASISMLDGPRARTDAARISIRPIYRRNQNVSVGGPVDVTGSYPLSASLKLVTVRTDVESTTDPLNWGQQHWRSVQRMYEWHSRYNPAYSTASYDRYSLFFGLGSTNIASMTGSKNVSSWDTMSSSFTIEALVKPFSVTSALQDFTIASRTGEFYLGITGSTGRLVFSGSFMGLFTSSMAPNIKRWNHVTVRGTGGTGSFLIDLVDAGTFTFTGSMARTTPSLPALSLGNVFVSPTDLGGAVESGSAANAVGSVNRSFHGLMHDVRLWSTYRTDQQLSASFDRTLYASGSAGLLAYYRMNQGPLFSSSVDPALYSIGSGAFDHSTNGNHLSLRSFSTRVGPVWQPNDNPEFIAPQQEAVRAYEPKTLKVFNVPALMYGRQIATGSVEMTCRAYSSASVGLVRVIRDDGRGSLYISGSLCSSSLESKESYDGVRAERVGNVFYDEGLVVISDPSMVDVGNVDGASSHPSDLISISFRGQNAIPSRVVMCRADAGEFNASNNETFSQLDERTGKLVVDGDMSTRVTAVGLYDSKHRLVAVAKLAQPIRKRLVDRQCFRLRFDF